jgi:hypothetical protein
MNDTQPGQLIVPHSSSEDPRPPQPQQQPPAGAPVPDRPTEAPEPTPAPSPAPEQIQTPEPVSNLGTATDPALQDIAWEAAEFVDHHKDARWYGALAVAGVIGAVLAYILTKDKISTATVALVLFGFGLFAARKPRIQTYNLSLQGIQIGPKQYGLHDFKAFSVAQEGDVSNVILSPLKRFMPQLIICVAPEVEDRVFEFLTLSLPFERRRPDMVDSLMRRIRF